jgi:hypothetical protein
LRVLARFNFPLSSTETFANQAAKSPFRTSVTGRSIPTPKPSRNIRTRPLSPTLVDSLTAVRVAKYRSTNSPIDSDFLPPPTFPANPDFLAFSNFPNHSRIRLSPIFRSVVSKHSMALTRPKYFTP